MTVEEFDRFVMRWELEAPVLMDDLAHIKAELDKAKAVGVSAEVVLRGDYVEIVLGQHEAACRRRVPVRGALPKPGIAAALAAIVPPRFAADVKTALRK